MYEKNRSAAIGQCQSLTKFVSIHTNFKFWGKLYPLGIPQGIPYLLIEPDLFSSYSDIWYWNLYTKHTVQLPFVKIRIKLKLSDYCIFWAWTYSWNPKRRSPRVQLSFYLCHLKSVLDGVKSKVGRLNLYNITSYLACHQLVSLISHGLLYYCFFGHI